MKGQDGQAVGFDNKGRRRVLTVVDGYGLGATVFVCESEFGDMEGEGYRSEVFEAGPVVAEREIAEVEGQALYLWQQFASCGKEEGVQLCIQLFFVVVFGVEAGRRCLE